jgi:hypothetical protein
VWRPSSTGTLSDVSGIYAWIKPIVTYNSSSTFLRLISRMNKAAYSRDTPSVTQLWVIYTEHLEHGGSWIINLFTDRLIPDRPLSTLDAPLKYDSTIKTNSELRRKHEKRYFYVHRSLFGFILFRSGVASNDVSMQGLLCSPKAPCKFM